MTETRPLPSDDKELPSDVAKGIPLPTVTLSQIRASIPDQYFNPSLPLSLFYAFRDLLVCALLFHFRSYLPGPLYWLAQGTMFWAIFVVGHDCGHGSFSKSGAVNDAVGTFMHALILTPYTGWKLTHRHHHAHTCQLDKDETFAPWRDDEKFGNLRTTAKNQFYYGIGWLLYLFFGFNQPVNHFNPYDKRFKGHRVGILVSTLSVLTMAAFVTFVAYRYAESPLTWLLDRYLLPVFVFATWLVVTTFLHHQDDDVVWYDAKDWSYVRGQLSTVDRNLGWLLNNVTHDITTHQVHHLFPRMPHYHLVEATKCFRAAFPSLARVSDAGFFSEYVRLSNLYADNGHVDNAPFTLTKNGIVKGEEEASEKGVKVA